MITEPTASATTTYRFEVNRRLLDLNRRDRLALLGELDRMIAELPAGADPASELGSPTDVARVLRRAAGLPDVLLWWQRLLGSSVRFKVGLALMLAVAGALVLLSRYQLAPGASASPGPLARTSTAGDVREFRYTDDPVNGVTIGFTIHNPGALPVRLTSVELAWMPAEFGSQEVRMNVGDASRGADTRLDTAVPFRDTTIAAGAELTVWVTLRYTCEVPTRAPDQTHSIDQARLEFTVLGLPRTQFTPLPFVLAIEGIGRQNPACQERA